MEEDYAILDTIVQYIESTLSGRHYVLLTARLDEDEEIRVTFSSSLSHGSAMKVVRYIVENEPTEYGPFILRKPQ